MLRHRSVERVNTMPFYEAIPAVFESLRFEIFNGSWPEKPPKTKFCLLLKERLDFTSG